VVITVDAQANPNLFRYEARNISCRYLPLAIRANFSFS
jgi:hypothetical protein